MQSDFDILINHRFSHEYFDPDNFSPSDPEFGMFIDIYPTPQCSEILKGYRLLFKKTFNGFIIVAEMKKNAANNFIPLIDIEPGTKFNFHFTILLDEFLNITDIDQNILQPDYKLFFRNSEFIIPDLTTVPQKALYRIYDGTTGDVLKNPDHVIRLAPVLFFAPYDAVANPEKLVLKESNGHVIMEKMIPRDNNGNYTAARVLMSSNPFTEGVYILEEQDATGTVLVNGVSNYFLSGSTLPSKSSGILELTFTNSMSAMPEKLFEFFVDFKNRDVEWVYNLESESGVFSSNLLIDTGNAIGFVAQPAPASMQIFKSINPVPLSTNPVNDIDLVENNPAQKVIYSSLPNPDPKKLKTDDTINYRAEMFLKIK